MRKSHMISLTLFYTLFWMCIAIKKSISQPLDEINKNEKKGGQKENIKLGINGYSGKIFRNRVKRCIPQQFQNVELTVPDETPKYQTMKEDVSVSTFESVSDDAKDEIRIDLGDPLVPNKESQKDNSGKQVVKDSLVRKFIKCIIGRTGSEESVIYLKAYEQNKEDECLIRNNKTKENPEECAKAKKQVKINVQIENEKEISREKEIFISQKSGIQTRITTVRSYEDANEELAVPGPSRAIVRVFPSIEAMEKAMQKRDRKYHKDGFD
ncbi:uncharacterized protein TA13955 [Theileria annulata]|uniref:Uncharacterized protein n=1 Tax=Theileria annulata TaxID=5874 RepID=Q4UDD0_THEAN|nr:uncharacterized protein TA13955 [Theileria annulata]CAI74909.1 hypothetical protein TA13955 [Theileria annulata]|eukprot:XP_952641.1 hypothetical protein TA13955 [Theileria annulata]